MKFIELKIGDMFAVGRDLFIKTDNTVYPTSIPLSNREHNAIRLSDGHHMVFGESVTVESGDE